MLKSLVQGFCRGAAQWGFERKVPESQLSSAFCVCGVESDAVLCSPPMQSSAIKLAAISTASLGFAAGLVLSLNKYEKVGSAGSLQLVPVSSTSTKYGASSKRMGGGKGYSSDDIWLCFD